MNVMIDQHQQAVDAAFRAALKDVKARYRGAVRAGLEEKFAWERFQKVCKDVDTTDPRFPTEGQDTARFLLLDEVLLHVKAGTRKIRKS